MLNVNVSDKMLRFEVIDQGLGIPTDQQASIFDLFEQVNRDRSQGTGLGLAICKRLVDLQNGSIEIESEEGVGTTISFQLPLQIFDGELEDVLYSDDELRKIGSRVKSIKVLLADDTDFNVMVASDDLHWYFPEVNIDVAGDGKRAVELFKQNNYDLILMDVQMPEMDGYDATRKIRELEQSKDQLKKPIIAMTASILQDDLAKCTDAGMDDYLPKPYASHDLVNKVVAHLEEAS